MVEQLIFALFPLAGISQANAAPGGLCAANSEYADEDWITNLTLGSETSVGVAQGEIYKNASAQSMGTYTAGSDPNILAKTFTGSFQVPSTAYNGTVYGRAMLQFVEQNGEPIMCNSDPDAWDPGISAFEAGTVIDFKVKLTGGIDNPALANTGSDNASLGAIAAGLILGGSALTIVGNRRRRTSL